MTDNQPEAVSLTYNQARNRLKDINDDLERLSAKADKAESRSLSSEDQDYWDDLVSEAEAVNGHANRLRREAQRQQVRGHIAEGRSVDAGAFVVRGAELDSDPLGEPDSIEEKRFKTPWDISEMRWGLTPEQRGSELRARALCAIERMQGTNDDRRQASTKILERWDNKNGKLAEQVLATSSAAYLRAFEKLAIGGGQVALLEPDERAAVSRAMSLTDAAGGFLVPFQLDPSVILTSDGSYNQIRQIARKVVAIGDTWNGVSAGATSWSFDAEAAEVSDDTSTFVQPSITIRTARGFVPISLEAYMDEQNVTQEVATLLAQGKDDLESLKFILGASGSNEPIGIVTALVASSPTVVVTSATTDTFARADVQGLHDALPARYRSRSSWLANNSTYSLIRAFDTAGGSAFWTDLNNDVPANLIGKPIYEAEAMDGTATALAAHNYMLIAGDFSNYVIADRIGTTIDFIPHLFSTSNGRPTGQRGWFAYYRVGADSVNDGAFRLLDVT